MPPVLPKRCPNCAARAVKTEAGDWLCPRCGWTDEPAPWQPPVTEPGSDVVVPEPETT